MQSAPPFVFDDSTERKRRAAITQEELDAYLSAYNRYMRVGVKNYKPIPIEVTETAYLMGLWNHYHPQATAIHEQTAIYYYHKAALQNHLRAIINLCSLIQSVIVKTELLMVALPLAEADDSAALKSTVRLELGKLLTTSPSTAPDARVHLLKAIELNFSAESVDSAKWYMAVSYFQQRKRSVENWSRVLYWLEQCSKADINRAKHQMLQDVSLMRSSHRSILERTLRMMDRHGCDMSDEYLNNLLVLHTGFLYCWPSDLLRVRKEVIIYVPHPDNYVRCNPFINFDEEFRKTKEIMRDSELISPDLMKAATSYLPWYTESKRHCSFLIGQSATLAAKTLMSISFEFDDREERKKRDAMTLADYEAALLFIQTQMGMLTNLKAIAEAFYKLGLWYQYHADPVERSYASNLYKAAAACGMVGHLQSTVNFCTLAEPEIVKIYYLRKAMRESSTNGLGDEENLELKIVMHRELGKRLIVLGTDGNDSDSKVVEGRTHLLEVIRLGSVPSTRHIDVSSAKWHMGLSFIFDPGNEGKSVERWDKALYWFEQCSKLQADTLMTTCNCTNMSLPSHKNILGRVLRMMDELKCADNYLNMLWEKLLPEADGICPNLMRIRKEIIDMNLLLDTHGSSYEEELHLAKQLILGSYLMSPDLMKASAIYLPWFDNPLGQ